LGYENAKKYQVFLLVFALVNAEIFCLTSSQNIISHLYLISVIPLFMVINKTRRADDPKELDPLLKIQALSTLLFAITFGLGQII
jgi:1,4-dihydroxy-2-naphthoate octaprenyltransferase